MSLLDAYEPIARRPGRPDHDHAMRVGDYDHYGRLVVPLPSPVRGCERCDADIRRADRKVERDMAAMFEPSRENADDYGY
jgi:hypothetical protein